MGLMTLVPRTCAVRQEVEAWGQQHGPLPLVLEKPGRTRQEGARRWHGASVVRQVEVEDADGRLDMAERRFLVVHSSQWADQTAVAYAAAQAKEPAECLAAHIRRVEARWFACATAAYEGRGPGCRTASAASGISVRWCLRLRDLRGALSGRRAAGGLSGGLPSSLAAGG